MRLHAIVSDLDTARVAAAGGATVIQLRVKGASTDELVRLGRRLRGLAAMLVVNDDLEAALRLGADGVHLGREDAGAERAVAEGLTLGLSVAGVAEAIAAERRGADYLGVGPVWATPSKRDARQPIGLTGLGAMCAATSLPVIAIGGVDVSNARDCIKAGASGIAVIRASREAAALLAAIGPVG